MKKFLFIDLDDTLFQTLAKCGEEQDLRCAAYLSDGTPNSYNTPRQRAWFAMISEQMTLIPTTARDLAAFKRVELPFHSYTILNFGGVVVLPNGEIDTHWQAQIHREMLEAQAGLTEIIALIDRYNELHHLPGRARLIADCGTPFFVVLKDPDKNLARLAQVEKAVLTPWLQASGQNFQVHCNGNNLAILPKTLNKSRAVNYVSDLLRADHGDIMTLGMGDSLSDAAFMASCDYAIIPKGSQLAAAFAEV